MSLLDKISDEIQERISKMGNQELFQAYETVARHEREIAYNQQQTPFCDELRTQATSQPECGSSISGSAPLEVVQDPITEEVVETTETEKVEESLTPTEKKKLDLSDKIKELGGTPPGRGALKKYEEVYQALVDAKGSDNESDEKDSPEPEETTQEETPAAETTNNQPADKGGMTFDDAYDLCVEEYEKAKAQAKARYDQARARHASNARKLDTRRKVIAGGALFELASRDVEAALVLDRILDAVTRDADKKAFEDWERPGSKSGAEKGEAEGSGKTEGSAPSSRFDVDPQTLQEEANALMAETRNKPRDSFRT